MVSPIPRDEQGSEGHRRLDRALERGPGLGDAEVQRIVAGLAEQLVRADHDHRVVVLDADLEVAEAVLLEQAGLPQRGLDQSLRRRLAVLGQQPLVQRAGVDPDPDGGAPVTGRLRDLLHLVVERPDVPGVDPHRGATGVDRGKDVLGLEVDVGDHRDLRLGRDGRQRVGVVGARHGDPDDVTPGRGQLGDLLQRRVDVRGQRRGHRLHADRGVAADENLADLDLAGSGGAGRGWAAASPGCRGRYSWGQSVAGGNAPRYPVRRRAAANTRGQGSVPDLGEHPADRLQGALHIRLGGPPAGDRDPQDGPAAPGEGVIQAAPSPSSRRAASRVTSSGPKEAQTWVKTTSLSTLRPPSRQTVCEVPARAQNRSTISATPRRPRGAAPPRR